MYLLWRGYCCKEELIIHTYEDCDDWTFLVDICSRVGLGTLVFVIRIHRSCSHYIYGEEVGNSDIFSLVTNTKKSPLPV